MNKGRTRQHHQTVFLAVAIAILAVTVGSSIAFASFIFLGDPPMQTTIPQFPNVFWGDATVDGARVPVGYVVTAVVDRGLSTERHYALRVEQKGKYGGPRYNQRKLKVGGDLQGNIPHLAPLLFYVTADALPVGGLASPAGETVFHADYGAHFNRLDLEQ